MLGVGLEESEDQILLFEGGVAGKFEVTRYVAQLRDGFCFLFSDIHNVLGRGSALLRGNTPFLLSLSEPEVRREISLYKAFPARKIPKQTWMHKVLNRWVKEALACKPKTVYTTTTYAWETSKTTHIVWYVP